MPCDDDQLDIYDKIKRDVTGCFASTVSCLFWVIIFFVGLGVMFAVLNR